MWLTSLFPAHVENFSRVGRGSSSSRAEGRRKEWVFSWDLGLKPSKRNRICAFSLLEERSAWRSLRHCFHKGLSPWHSSKSKPAFETQLNSKTVKGRTELSLCFCIDHNVTPIRSKFQERLWYLSFILYINVFKHLFHAKCCAQSRESRDSVDYIIDWILSLDNCSAILDIGSWGQWKVRMGIWDHFHPKGYQK